MASHAPLRSVALRSVGAARRSDMGGTAFSAPRLSTSVRHTRQRRGKDLRQAMFARPERRLRAIAQRQLGENVRDVVLDRSLGDVERLTDLAIARAAREIA